LDKIGRERNVPQIKEKDNATARVLRETDISNMPDGEFKAMITIFTELEKRVEDNTETLDTEKRNNTAE